MLRTASFTLVLGALCFGLASAQDVVPTAITPTTNSGALPYSTTIGTDAEQVDLASGNLIINIPFVNVPGRKMSFRYGLRYDARFLMMVGFGANTKQWQIERKPWLTADMVGWTSTQPYFTSIRTKRLVLSGRSPNFTPGQDGTVLTWSVKNDDSSLTPDHVDFTYDIGLSKPGNIYSNTQYGTTTGSYIFTDNDGVKHDLGLQVGAASGFYGAYDGSDYSRPSKGDDGIFSYTLLGGRAVTIIQPDGTLLVGGTGQPGTGMLKDTYLTTLSGETDVHGNSQGFTPNSLDSLGRSLIALQTTSSGLNYTYKDTTGVNQTYVAQTSQHSLQTNFQTRADPSNSSSGYQEFAGNRTLIDSIALPNGTSYQFSYDSYGYVTHIDLPTHGSVDYEWANLARCGIEEGIRSVTKRTVHDGQHSSAWSLNYSASCSNQQVTAAKVQVTFPIDSKGHSLTGVYVYDSAQRLTKVIKSASGTTLRQYDILYDDQYSQVADSHLMESITTTLDDGQVSKRTFEYDRYTFPTDASGCGAADADEMNCENLGNQGAFPLTSLQPFSSGNVSAIYEYGWAQGQPGPLVRQTIRTYLHQQNPGYQAGQTPYSFNGKAIQIGGPNIVNRIVSETVYDASVVCHGSGTLNQNSGAFDPPAACTAVPISRTTYEYDHTAPGTSGYLGDLTAVAKTLDFSTGAKLTSTYDYDVHGNLWRLHDSDPTHGYTTLGYEDSWNAALDSCPVASGSASYPTSVTTSPNAAISLRRELTYSPCTGLVVGSRDVNDVAQGRAGKSTQYDALGRPTLVYYGSDLLTQTIYDDQRNVTEGKTFRTATDFTDTFVSTDGLGRTITSKVVDLLGDVSQETSYDGLGRVVSHSNPHRSVAASSDGTTLNEYDGLDRLVTTTLPNGDSHIWSYSGNVADEWDEAHVHWKRTSDLLGLRQVAELGTPSTPVNNVTSYDYDLSGNLTAVNQVGGGSSVRRQFSYDPLSRLTTSCNPEALPSGALCDGSHWSLSYQYDPNGTVRSKTDARGLVTSYLYDAVGRTTAKMQNGLQIAEYDYDGTVGQWAGSGFLGSDPNSVGRLSFVRSFNPALGLQSCNLTTRKCDDQYFGYDPMGRLKHWVGAPPSEWGYDAHSVDASYDLAGDMTQLVYPDNSLSLNQHFDTVGRLDSVTNSASGQPYMTVNDFLPTGSPKKITFGNGVVEDLALNSRLQPCDHDAFLPIMAGGSMVMHKQYFYSASATSPCADTTGNNGNIYQIGDVTNTTQQSGNYTQTFDYDPLNRLKSFDVLRMGGQHRHQDFTYDSFGNLLGMNSTVPPPGTGIDPLSFSATYQPGNNRMNASVFHCLPLWQGVTPQGTAGQVDVYDAAGNVGCSGNQGSDAHAYVWDPESRLGEVWSQQNNNTYAQSAIYTYDAQGNRIRADQMAPSGPNGQPQSQAFREYSFFGGQMLAEKDQNSDWTDYVYAFGHKIATVKDALPAIHLSGVRGPDRNMACGTIWYVHGQSSWINGYVVQTGDRLSYDQRSDLLGVTAALTFTDGSFAANEAAADGNWHHVDIDLSNSSGKVVADYVVGPGTPYQRQGTWNAYERNMVLTGADGSVRALFTNGNLSGWTPTDCGSSNPQFAVETTPIDQSDGTTYYLADHLGTTQLEFSSFGAPLWRGEFAPFGQELSDPLSTAQRFKFTGKERDSESGLDYFGARYYASSMGRFMSADPKQISKQRMVDPQQWNMYSYTRNNPLNAVDPDGREVKLLNSEALARVQSTLPANVRSQVKVDANGMLNKSSIAGIKGDDSNVRALQTMVASPKVLEFGTGKAAGGYNFEYQSKEAVQATVKAASGDPSTITGPNLYLGLTTFANKSPDGNTQIMVSDGTGPASTTPESQLAITAAHELYVHGLNDMTGQPAEHETNQDGSYNPNGPVNQQTQKVEDHTRDLQKPQ